MKFAALAVAVAAVAVSLPASAGDFEIRANGDMSVRYGDLDLSTHQGQDALVARIDGVAREACRVNYRQPVNAERACRDNVEDAFNDAATGPAREALIAVQERDQVRPATFAAR